MIFRSIRFELSTDPLATFPQPGRVRVDAGYRGIMRQTRIEKKMRRPREMDEVLSFDPRDPDVQRAKRLVLESVRPDPTKRVD